MKIRFDAIFCGVMLLIAGIKMFFTGYVWTAPITPAASMFVCIFGVVVIFWGIFGNKIIRKD